MLQNYIKENLIKEDLMDKNHGFEIERKNGNVYTVKLDDKVETINIRVEYFVSQNIQDKVELDNIDYIVYVKEDLTMFHYRVEKFNQDQ